MIRTLYGTFGAATGITQGLIRGTFKSLQVKFATKHSQHRLDNQFAEPLNLIGVCEFRFLPHHFPEPISSKTVQQNLLQTALFVTNQQQQHL